MTRYQIGELARMTGLTVKTIRFYSDSGLIPPTDRTAGGYRTYDAEAVARLKLVRTLRDLGVDLPTAGRVLAKEVSVTDVARAHADAIDAQMRTLRLRRAVLRAVAKGGEMELMNELARMSDEERQRILDDFFEDVFGPYELDPQFEQHMRSVRIELPDDPSPEQLEAWVELAKLVQDPDFRASIKRMSRQHEQYRRDNVNMTPPSGGNQMETFTYSIDQARQAIEAGIAPDSAEAAEVVARVNAKWAEALDVPNDETVVRRLREFADFADPRAERYWVLIGRVNGWPAMPDNTREREWLRAAGVPLG
ncbi:MerR family transcriptional regulator [Lentzea sp. NPDC042327]|uniref:helix-turn-helix domain-containing protein n=1 Tax=Lentzea sp. NPDC042327 TaxID=3154801 RepID=UPI0033CD1DB4